MDFGKDYKSGNVFGVKPTPIVVVAARLVSSHSPLALDLGTGQGRDALFLAQHGFSTIALDRSTVGLKQIVKTNSNIKTTCADLNDYKIIGMYDLIIAINSLQFLEKNNIVRMTNEIKSHLKTGGLVAISVLLDNGKIRAGELKAFFKDFTIIKYAEFEKKDAPHPGAQFPHVHKMAQIIVRKD
jgi:tellurite methyltransferase